MVAVVAFEVVISLLVVLTACVDVVGVVVAVVFFVLFLPQAKSAPAMAITKNIARIFFIIFSFFVDTMVKL